MTPTPDPLYRALAAAHAALDAPTPDPLREAAQSLIDVIGTGGLVGTSAAIMDLGDAIIAVQFALAQPVPALDVERLAPFLAVEFGKAGFFAPTASMEFLHAQATMMLADAVAEYASRETLDVP